MEELEFLQLRTEAEAMARGANLSEKIPHAVFQTIRQFSHTDQLKSGNYFYIGYHIPQLGTLEYGQSGIQDVLEELIKERLITQLFLIKFDPTAHGLKLIPCYIARPEDARLTTEQLYKDLLMQSVDSIESYVKTSPGLDRQSMLKDLELDFKSERPPPPEKLTSTLFSPLQALDPANFDFVPNSELIHHATEILTEELLRRKIVLPLVEYGWMPVRAEELIRRFEIAQEFLNQTLVPHFRSQRELYSEIKSIQSSEESYYLDGFVRKTADFGFKKASAVKKHLMSGIDRKNRIAGSLTLEIILGLHRDAEKAYEEIWKMDRDREYKEVRNSIVGSDVPLAERLKFFEEEDLAEITPEVWQRIVSGVDFLHATYERSNGTCNVLTRNDVALFPPLVKMLLSANSEEHWKILAFRALIDRHEAALHSLFYDTEFLDSYGQLLRKAYWSRIPWYFRLLLLLGLRGFTDSAFQGAKKRISEEQENLSTRNQKKRDTADRQRIIQRKEKAAQAETMEFARRIIDIVDRSIYEEHLPPRISEVAALLPDGHRLESFVESHGFKTVEHGDSKLLLYPIDFNWRGRSARLRRFLEKQLETGHIQGEAESRIRAVLQSVESSLAGAARPNVTSKATTMPEFQPAAAGMVPNEGDY
ncbi:MAG: hypothetical protein RH862_16825 [Leptospiraceae bacterium]